MRIVTKGLGPQPYELEYALSNPRKYLERRLDCKGNYPASLESFLNNLSEEAPGQEERGELVSEIIGFVRSIRDLESRSDPRTGAEGFAALS
jgi:hypothetical protein